MPRLRVIPVVAVLGGASDLIQRTVGRRGRRGSFGKGSTVHAARAGFAALVAASAVTATFGTASAAGAGPSAAPPPHPPRTDPSSGAARSSAAARPGHAQGHRSAPRIEEVAARVGLGRLREIRAQAVADLNRAAEESFGPFDAAKAAVIGRPAYYDDQDVDVFVLDPDARNLDYVAVPVGFDVSESGEITLPDPDPAAYGAPLFNGPWDNTVSVPFVANNTDDGGLTCGTTSAHTVLQALFQRLADHSATSDYWGVDLTGVAEVTKTSKCNDFVDGARIGFKSSTPGAVVLAEDPVVGFSHACTNRRVTVGASWGGVSASVAQDYLHCERIGVTGALQPASTMRQVIFDNNHNCHAGDAPFDGRELAKVAVLQVPQGKGPGLILSFGADAGNKDTCKEDQC